MEERMSNLVTEKENVKYQAFKKKDMRATIKENYFY